MDLTEGEITRLYRVRKTVMQMLKDWDYIIVDHDLNKTMLQFQNKYGENMKRDDDLSIEGSEIYVFFPDEPKIGVKTIKNYIKHLVQDDTDKAIVLIQQKSDSVCKALHKSDETKVLLGVFPGNMVLTEEEIMRLYRVRKTMMQMLKDRDYLIVDHDLNMTMSQFKNKHGENMKREDLTINKRKRDDESYQIYVFFPDEPKVWAKTMKSYITRMNQENVIRAILVVQQNLTPFAKTSISEIGSKYHLEIFQEAELLVNIKEHVLVPEHRFLQMRKRRLAGEVHCEINTGYYGLKRGQVVKILRPSEAAGRYVTYRYVIQVQQQKPGLH